ncbi:short-chain dehydrogenase [Halobacillus halophilus]|uniref:Short-chain dehydrogenase/reductase family protein n=1 Tax=Halobacillus halophilus (strain ATCC 35676 / DSM 2266 / JCM 20832 / KCTC 3685 / LMG 17431 / NBRC 102448 / NCIMB 2269) TaxID=866895 RepID=I0JQA0_HALH3|nr:SDR family NAD(P)-dependent oxidoreductase [Halobacillus halophilus]ASF40337.1 short-chain dehydrogenase [Halobacillus halophilus]CCG46320.1 short-chain dehydrogenase/reductase family protein [Halobacillus halophilus DSM 2266]
MSKIAIVTGANRGLGFETCRQLAQQGFKVWLGARNEEKGEKAAGKLLEEGGDVHYIFLDVAQPDKIGQVKDQIIEQDGKIDVLINNAGIFSDKKSSILEIDTVTFEDIYLTNYFGPYFMMSTLMPVMVENNYGRIVNLAAEMGVNKAMDAPMAGAYKASKYGLNGLTRLFAGAARRKNIKVNSVSPCWVKTDLGGEKAKREPEQAMEGILWLAQLEEDGPNGKFFRDREELEF